jgi:hypothetical protein
MMNQQNLSIAKHRNQWVIPLILHPVSSALSTAYFRTFSPMSSYSGFNMTPIFRHAWVKPPAHLEGVKDGQQSCHIPQEAASTILGETIFLHHEHQ